MSAAVPKYETEWFQPPLPPARRAYGIHVNYGVLKGKDKITYGHGQLAIIRDVENPNMCEVFTEHKAKVTVVSASPNGNWVASGDDTGVVHVWGYPNMILKNTVRIGNCIQDLRWTADSKRIVAAGNGNNEFAKAFNFDSSNPLGKIDRITKVVLTCDWSPTMPHRVATADEDLTVNFYHGVPFKHNSRTLKHTRYPNVLRYAPDGSVFATCGSDAKIFLYDGKTGEVVKELVDENGHTGSIFGLAWGPDSKELVTASADKTVKVWNVEQGKVVHTWNVSSGSGEWDDQQACVMWGASGQIVSVSISGALNFWSRESEQPTRVQVGHLETVGAFALSQSTTTAYSGDMAGRICKWDANTGACQWFTGSGHGVKPISALAVSCAGDKVYSAGLDNVIRVNDAAKATFGETVGVVPNQVKSLAAGKADNDVAAFVTVQGQVGLVRGGKVVHTAEVKDASKITFSADDKQVYIAGNTAKVMFIFNVDGEKLVAAPASADEFQQPCLALAASAKFVASTQHNEINVWNEDFTQSRSYGWAYHTLRITSMKWSPSGNFLATGGSDKQIIIWRDFEKFKPRPVVLPEIHTLGITDFDWIDEKSLVVLGDDGCIKKINVTADL